MNKQRDTLQKRQRLYLKRDFDALFAAKTKFIVAGPLKIHWITQPLTDCYPVKFGVSVPKKKFANATDRNRIKRQIREAYRKNKLDIITSTEAVKLSTLILVIYNSTTKTTYKLIEENMILGLRKIQKNNE